MAKASKITATFSDGQKITRTTVKTLTHAWRVLYTNTAFGSDKVRTDNTGFSGSEELARKAAQACMKPSRTYRPVAMEVVAID